MNIKLISIAALMAVSASVASAVDYKIEMTGSTPGTYKAKFLDGTPALGAYVSPFINIDGNKITTMCLEKFEYFSSPGEYTASITGSRAFDGGADKNETPNLPGDPISVGTARLYKELVTGTLKITGLLNGALAEAVQETIWYLEDERTTTNDAVDKVLAYLGNTLKADYTGNEVQVMNLTQNGVKKQDQLVLMRVPDSGTTLTMLGAALCALAIFRRRSA